MGSHSRKIIRLVMVAGERLDILPFALDHYRELGVTDFHIFLNGTSVEDPIVEVGKKILEERGLLPEAIAIEKWQEELPMQLMRPLMQKYPEDWFVVADQDELQLYPKKLSDVIGDCEAKGYKVLCGLMLDRIGKEGAFPELTHGQSLWQQMPLAGRFSEVIAHADTRKVVLCKGSVELGAGQHTFYCSSEEECPLHEVAAQVHHFKWTHGCIERLSWRAKRFGNDLHPSFCSALAKETESLLRFFGSAAQMPRSDESFHFSECSRPDYYAYPHWDQIIAKHQAKRESALFKANRVLGVLLGRLLSISLLLHLINILLAQLNKRTPLGKRNYDVIKHELHCLRIRHEYKGITIPIGTKFLSLGCGGIFLPERWIGLDVYATGLRIHRYDCRDHLPFQAAAFEMIHMEHLFEHLDRFEHAERVLNECCRCLEEKGILRIVVPDGPAYLAAYQVGNWSALTDLRPLQSKSDGSYWDPIFDAAMETRMDVVNLVFHQGGQHYYAYDYETLEKLLLKAGFAAVARCHYGESRHPEWHSISPELSSRARYSLYVEAYKN